VIADWPAGGFVLSELVRDARVRAVIALPDSQRGFEAMFGRAFIVRFTGRLKEKLPSMATPALGLVPGVESETTGDTMVIVHPLARRPSSEHPFISIGRIDKNDVCLADESVSKFHAYVKDNGAGGYVLQDARSRNGTTLDGKVVPGRGLGEPLAITSGQAVRFGGVDSMFLDAKATLELLTRLSKSG
jgi:hypothetical protein